MNRYCIREACDYHQCTDCLQSLHPRLYYDDRDEIEFRKWFYDYNTFIDWPDMGFSGYLAGLANWIVG